MKLPNRHWLMANMGYEAFSGFNAFNTKKLTDKDVIDFLKFRQFVAESKPMTEEAFAEVFAKPKA